MRYAIRNIRYLVFALAVLFSAKAFSAYSDCTAPLPAFINLPSVSVPTNLALGQNIPGAKASFSITITCTNKFNGSVHRAVSSVKCNTSNEILLELREDFVGRLEAEDFARAVVQGMLNGSEFLMRDVAQVHTFG